MRPHLPGRKEQNQVKECCRKEGKGKGKKRREEKRREKGIGKDVCKNLERGRGKKGKGRRIGRERKRKINK